MTAAVVTAERRPGNVGDCGERLAGADRVVGGVGCGGDGERRDEEAARATVENGHAAEGRSRNR